jgi:hypothetical protein
MQAEIVLDWPPLQDDCHLQLMLQMTITGTQGGVAEARILAYDFGPPIHRKRNRELTLPLTLGAGLCLRLSAGRPSRGGCLLQRFQPRQYRHASDKANTP